MSKTRIIAVGGLIDGRGGAVHRRVFLALQDGIITAIRPAAELGRDARDNVDKFPHCTIVPPLVDCSVFLLQSPGLDSRVRAAAAKAGPAARKGMAARHIGYCQTHGVLGLAACDEDVHGLLPRQSAIDIRTAGADFLRILYTDSIDGSKAPGHRRNKEELRVILQQRGRKKAVVLANGRKQVREALAAGCDAIEQGYAMGEDNLRLMAEKNVLWIPSVLMAQNGLQGAGSGGDVMCRFSMRYVAPGKAEPGSEAFWKEMLTGQLAQLNLARRLGVRTAVGTGAGRVGILHGESMSEEIKLFIRAGYSLEEAIRCGSVNGAWFFGMESLGEMAVGRPATFLLVRGTVQQLPRKLAFLEGICVEGNFVH